jgi:hypothetical protein
VQAAAAIVATDRVRWFGRDDLLACRIGARLYAYEVCRARFEATSYAGRGP